MTADRLQLKLLILQIFKKIIHTPLILIIFFLSFTLFSCIQTNVTQVSSETYPQITPEEVTIYSTAASIPENYTEVAIIHAEGSDSFTDQSQMYEKVRKDAAELGANGIIPGDIEDPSSGERVVAAVFGTGTTRTGEFVAIFVPDEE